MSDTLTPDTDDGLDAVIARTELAAAIHHNSGHERSAQLLDKSISAMRAQRLARTPGATYQWCERCNDRDRLHIAGRCHVCGHDPADDTAVTTLIARLLADLRAGFDTVADEIDWLDRKARIMQRIAELEGSSDAQAAADRALADAARRRIEIGAAR